jgi:hypothetical protein
VRVVEVWFERLFRVGWCGYQRVGKIELPWGVASGTTLLRRL